MLQLTIQHTIELMHDQWKRLLVYSLVVAGALMLVGVAATALLMNGIHLAGPGGMGSFVAQLQTALIGILLLMCLSLTVVNIGCAAMIRTCRIDEHWTDSVREAVRQLPSLSAQSGILALPMLIGMVLVAVSGSWTLGLLLLIGMAPFVVTVWPLYMLVSVECAMGSRELMPRRAWRMFISEPGTCIALGFGLMISSLITSIPLIGLAAGALFFAVLSAASAALHAVIDIDGTDIPTRESRAADTSPAVSTGGAPTHVELQHLTPSTRDAQTHSTLPAQAHATPTPPGLLSYLPSGMQPYATATGVCQPGLPHSEWIGMPIDGVLVLQLASTDGMSPGIGLTSQDGRALHVSDQYPDGCVYVQAPAGWYSLTLTSASHTAHTWSLSTFPVPNATWNAAMSGWAAGSSEQRRPA